MQDVGLPLMSTAGKLLSYSLCSGSVNRKKEERIKVGGVFTSFTDFPPSSLLCPTVEKGLRKDSAGDQHAKGGAGAVRGHHVQRLRRLHAEVRIRSGPRLLHRLRLFTEQMEEKFF